MRGLACELNNSCYNTSREKTDTTSVNLTQLYQLAQIATNVFEFTNQDQVVRSATNLTQYFNEILLVRDQAGAISGNLTLSQYIHDSVPTFTRKLYEYTNSSTFVITLLSSNPNYNYLYSNHSVQYKEENFLLKGLISTQVQNPQEYIDLLYGTDLDVNINFSSFRQKYTT